MISSSRIVRRLVLPLTRLHVPFVSARIAHAVEQRLDDRHVSCRVRGVRWRLDLNELIEHRIFYLGTHERFTTRRILEAMPKGGVFVDVGANIGYFTVLVAHQLAGTGHVYAFEPMQRAMDKLLTHVRENALRNVTAVRAVLSDQARGPIEVAFQNSWQLYEKDTGAPTKETIPTMTLDEYVEEHRVRRIDVLKVDVDGYELKVLSGARTALRNMRPRILIELGKYTLRSVGDTLDELVDLLSSAGYRFYSETTMRRFGSTREVMANVPEDATLNVVCIAP